MLIRWVGDERFTKYGAGTPGNEFHVPDSVGESYIKQGLAEKVVPTKKEGKS